MLHSLETHIAFTRVVFTHVSSIHPNLYIQFMYLVLHTLLKSTSPTQHIVATATSCRCCRCPCHSPSLMSLSSSSPQAHVDVTAPVAPCRCCRSRSPLVNVVAAMQKKLRIYQTKWNMCPFARSRKSFPKKQLTRVFYCDKTDILRCTIIKLKNLDWSD